jgi:hypothetical protein
MNIQEIEECKKFSAWLSSAKRGDRFVYFTGLLGRARDKISGGAYKEIDALGNFAYDQHVSGVVNLVQNKRGIEQFEYIAVKK